MSASFNGKEVIRIYKGTQKVYEQDSAYDYIPFEVNSSSMDGTIGIYIPKENPSYGYVVGGYMITNTMDGAVTLSISIPNKTVSGSFYTEEFWYTGGTSGNQVVGGTVTVTNNEIDLGNQTNVPVIITGGTVTIGSSVL
ncbi:hypothetical protein YK48G_03810 [Lentilactobacillus fungorum]|uniref:Uncharacterized protein n=1 Tax=Lentilactobacillus fungorum TaxID=2201250 RepID=A0ABQ3VY93_9LACO|nr:hypothetical protein [Lentilactobacillus fungorum]GHP12956.1 hypothetical protein YK48G_03810 [Lentilactobacillus fungorum]